MVHWLLTEQFSCASEGLKAAVHWAGEAWLRVGAIIADLNMDGYGVAR